MGSAGVCSMHNCRPRLLTLSSSRIGTLVVAYKADSHEACQWMCRDQGGAGWAGASP